MDSVCHKVPEGEDIPGRRQEINAHLQMFSIIIVYPFKCQPTPHNVTRIVAEVGVGERVSDFDVASSCSEAFQTCRNHFWCRDTIQLGIAPLRSLRPDFQTVMVRIPS